MRIFTTIFGLLAALILAFSCISKAMHWPGANLGIILSAGLLSPVYLLLTLITVGMQRKRTLATLIPIGFFVVIFLIGVLFSLMHWPGGKTFSLFSLLILIPLIFVFAIIHTARKPEERAISPDALILLLIACSLIFSAMHRSVTKGVLVGNILSNENEIALSKILANHNYDLLMHIDSTRSREAEAIQVAATNFSTFAEKLKHDIGLRANNDEAFRSYDQISELDNPDIGSYMMYSDGNTEQLVLLYEKALQAINKSTIPEETKTHIRELLELNKPDLFTNENSWQELYFKQTPVISIEATLSSLQTKVLLAENMALQQLQKK
ncbi:MAG: hypothetical protein JST26_04325 [Bacteroidetes bacterium]|nr:hypothetical protein [Bacteroidota bacterium]